MDMRSLSAHVCFFFMNLLSAKDVLAKRESPHCTRIKTGYDHVVGVFGVDDHYKTYGNKPARIHSWDMGFCLDLFLATGFFPTIM